MRFLHPRLLSIDGAFPAVTKSSEVYIIVMCYTRNVRKGVAFMNCNDVIDKKNAVPENEWDQQVCRHLDELWKLSHSPQAVFYEPEETRVLMQERIDAAIAKQKSFRGLDYAV